MNPLVILDFAGVFVFAATGALAAARGRHDIMTFAFFAAVTGTGGGTLRDLLIGAPVFWVQDARYVLVCLAAALTVWMLGERMAGWRALLWLDAIGLAAFSVVGAGKALAYGVDPVIAVVMGVLTASFGGVVREVLAHEPSILLRREIYLTAGLVAASIYVVGRLLHTPEPWAAIVGIAAGFAVRAGALVWGWAMPGYRGRKDNIGMN